MPDSPTRAETRRLREAEALRENLHRRKAQSRAQAAQPPKEPEPPEQEAEQD